MGEPGAEPTARWDGHTTDGRSGSALVGGGPGMTVAFGVVSPMPTPPAPRAGVTRSGISRGSSCGRGGRVGEVGGVPAVRPEKADTGRTSSALPWRSEL